MNLIRTTWEDGSYRKDEYNARNLLTSSKYYIQDDEQTLQTDYTYDSQGRQSRMVDSRVTGGTLKAYRYTDTGYDSYGRKAWESETDTDSTAPSDSEIEKHKIRYTYDAEDKLTAVTYPMAGSDAQGLHYSYDSYRRLKEIKVCLSGGQEKLLRSYTYDAFGRVSKIHDYPGVLEGKDTCIVKTYTYNSLDQVIRMVYKKGSAVLESYAYAYDKNGNITEQTEVNNAPEKDADKVNLTKAYTYDALGRLVKTVQTDHQDSDAKTVTTYSYDKAGNRLKKTEAFPKAVLAETAYTYNGLDQLLTAVTSSGGKDTASLTYDYDVNGNQIMETDSVSGDTTENTYDTAGRLSSVNIQKTIDGKAVSVTQENLYNGNGQRIYKKEGTSVTRYQYQDGTLFYTTGEDSSEKQIQNLIGLNGNILFAEDCAEGSSTGNTGYLYDKDIQGSTVNLLDGDGDSVLFYEYGDFGETDICGESTFENEICFTSAVYDKNTGLYYLNARYYDPADGRFLTQDTYQGEEDEPETWHLYVYCANDPVNYVDPSGHIAIQLVYYLAAGAIVYGQYLIIRQSYTYRSNHKKIYVYVVELINNRKGHKVKHRRAKSNKSKRYKSKGGKQNIKDSGLVGVDEDEISKKAKDKTLSPKERSRYTKQEKALRKRNQQKRDNLTKKRKIKKKK